MSEASQTKYYAVVGRSRTRDDPGGLVRRQFTPEGRLDEALQRDMSWTRSTGLVAWEHGEIEPDFVEIDEHEANELIERFREKWSAGQ